MQVPVKFIKLMMMTTSNSDGEALTALRKANALLAEANVNWEEFLKLVGTSNAVTAPKSKQPTPPWEDGDGFHNVGPSGIKYTDADEINALFEKAFAKTRPTSSFREFLESVHGWWEANGFLTEKQYFAIRKSALR